MPILTSSALPSRASAPDRRSTWRKRTAQALLGLSVVALLLGAISIFSIGVFIMVGALPFFALGIALHSSRTHFVIGGIGLVGGLVGAGLLAYFLVAQA